MILRAEDDRVAIVAALDDAEAGPSGNISKPRHRSVLAKSGERSCWSPSNNSTDPNHVLGNKMTYVSDPLHLRAAEHRSGCDPPSGQSSRRTEVVGRVA